MPENVNQGVTNTQTTEPNLDDIIKDITGNTGAPVQEPPKTEEPKPITVNLNGQQYQFKDEAELSTSLSQLVQNLQQPQQPTQYVSGKEDDLPKQPQWTEKDMQEYVRLMGTNPIEAQNYVDRKRFGADDPVGMLRQTVVENQKLQRALAAIQFRDAHANLPLSPQFAQVLESRRQQLGVPFTYEGLEASYWSLVGTGVLPPPQFPQQQQGQQQQPQPRQGFGGYQFGNQQPQYNAGPVNPPPSIPRTNTPEPDLDYQVASRFENMTKEDLAKVLAEYDNRMRQGR